MKIDGDYTFGAPRQLVWSLLHDPDTIRQAIPGCNQFRLQDDGRYSVVLNLDSGPLGGHYHGLVTLVDEQPVEAFSLSMTGSGPENIVSGEGRLILDEEDGKTKLHYEGDVDVAGGAAYQSSRLLRTTANSLIRNYLEAVDQQLGQITGSPGQNGLPPLEPASAERKTSTIDMQDWIAELRRDRWVALFLLILLLFAALSFLGAVFVGLLLARWAARNFAGRVSRLAEERSGEQSLELEA